jgi:hypothetical protein
MIVFDAEDSILALWRKGTNGTYGHLEQLHLVDKRIPIAIRGMTKRKIMASCREEGRDFYYIDTGYLGNLGKRKDYHRVVKNDVQHINPVLVPDDRWKNLVKYTTAPMYLNGWRKGGSNILIVTPSEKPCKYYGITRDEWLNNTIKTLKEHTDRKIIIRDKPPRRQRVGDSSIYKQMIDEKIYAVVTYNSIAATEAVGFGVPAFANAPVNAAKTVCSNDFTKIETPFYPDREQVDKWLHWLAYCQYTPEELQSGYAYNIQEKLQLC